jgi:diguanylate cyclase (GGDEF)-like protein
MSKSDPVKLLILEESQNRAEELIVLLRTAGRATRAHQIESEADLTEKLQEHPWDLLLATSEANGLTAENVIKQIASQEKDVPVILIADNQDHESIVEGMKIGALDVALDDDDERLILIIERELKNLDIRRQKRKAEVELRETDRRNQLLLASSNAAIAYVHEGMHIYTNAAYAALFGYEDPDDFAGIPIIDLIATQDQEKFKDYLKSFSEDDSEGEEFNCINSSDENMVCDLFLTPATYDGESCTQVIFRTRLLVDESAIEDRIKEISSQDLLTGLFNRQYFVDQLEVAMDGASNGKATYVLFYISVDHFARMRTEAGISNADLVLGQVATLIRGMVDDKHIMARFGDDVFSLLFDGGDKGKAAELAEDIRAKVEGHLSEVSGKTYQLTVRIGLSLISENAPSTEEVISRAYQAADTIEDGNAVNFYQAEQVTIGEDDKTVTTEHIKEMVRDGLEKNTLKLVFQPIISLHGESDEQFEVLLRLLDEDENELFPGQFLGPAEDAGLLEKIDRWVILQSINFLSEQRESGGKARLFINITHKSIADESFLPWMGVALKAAKLPSDAIVFQFHENDATSYIKQAAEFTTGLATIHCKTSINHFGCSLNPLNLLKHLTPDFVKLDASFAEQLEESEEKQQELLAMVSSLQTSGALTVISGVETPVILPTLWEAGVNFIQGYYISPPLDNLEYDFSDEDL